MKNKLTPAQAIEHLHKVKELLEYFLADREDEMAKSMLKNNRLVAELIMELTQDKLSDHKRVRKKIMDLFGKQKEEVEAENKKLKIELQQEKEKVTVTTTGGVRYIISYHQHDGYCEEPFKTLSDAMDRGEELIKGNVTREVDITNSSTGEKWSIHDDRQTKRTEG